MSEDVCFLPTDFADFPIGRTNHELKRPPLRFRPALLCGVISFADLAQHLLFARIRDDSRDGILPDLHLSGILGNLFQEIEECVPILGLSLNPEAYFLLVEMTKYNGDILGICLKHVFTPNSLDMVTGVRNCVKQFDLFLW